MKSEMFDPHIRQEALTLLFNQQSNGRMMKDQTHSRMNSSGGTSDRKNVTYPHYVKCE